MRWPVLAPTAAGSRSKSAPARQAAVCNNCRTVIYLPSQLDQARLQNNHSLGGLVVRRDAAEVERGGGGNVWNTECRGLHLKQMQTGWTSSNPLSPS